MTGDAPSLLGAALAATTDDTSRDLGPLVESALKLVKLSDHAPTTMVARDGPRVSQAAAASDGFARALYGAGFARSDLEEDRRQGDRRGLALEDDARLQRQLQGLARVYRTLAHELRAPLGAVMLNLDLLQESLGEDVHPNERAQRLVGVLRRELDRLNRSLHGILTGTLPDASPERFDLGGSLRDLVVLLAPQARRQSVELEVHLGDDPLPVRGYPDRLRQAFLNVAVNALEAMPHGGRLRLEARRDGTWARVAVRDSGPGIPAAALPRVYDPEFTTKDGGSGIGLHVARAAVELHGGEIGVSSRPGHGTAVHVAVPLAPGAAPT